MNESEVVLDLFIKQQQEKINELSQQLLLLSTKNKYLSQKLEETEASLKKYIDINKKETNTVTGFKHQKTTLR